VIAVVTEANVEQQILKLIEDPMYAGHPLLEALGTLWEQYQAQLAQIERVTSISDGYQSVLMEKNLSLGERYARQIRQLRKIVRISDHYQAMLRDVNVTLKLASTRDPLTNLANRRLMLERMTEEVASASRLDRPLSANLVDIDHFKQINDRLGHDAGDRVLIGIARALALELRAYDVCARWGGEEFMVLLPDTRGVGALRVAERLCRNVYALHHLGLPADVRVSVSIGVAEYHPDYSLNDMIKRADDALYEAKNSGRNRAVLAGATALEPLNASSTRE
jgi:diguanylate cyclase (GGDEF)-like protein